jgi:hypothetical protein
MLNFGSLSRNERRAATKLAKELVRTVPAAQNADEPLSIRGALSTAFMKPENVIGALVYTDLEGNWWGDVVLRKGKKKCFQMGSREEPPLQSCEDALECVKNLIASIKATREHPIVQEFRERGFDPEQIELLRVRHEKFGCRWVLLDEKQILSGAKAFAELVEREFGGVVDKLEQARAVILRVAPQFAVDPVFLRPAGGNDEQEGEVQSLHFAAAFLMRNGILNVDRDTNSETISDQPPARWFH